MFQVHRDKVRERERKTRSRALTFDPFQSLDHLNTGLITNFQPRWSILIRQAMCFFSSYFFLFFSSNFVFVKQLPLSVCGERKGQSRSPASFNWKIVMWNSFELIINYLLKIDLHGWDEWGVTVFPLRVKYQTDLPCYVPYVNRLNNISVFGEEKNNTALKPFWNYSFLFSHSHCLINTRLHSKR